MDFFQKRLPGRNQSHPFSPPPLHPTLLHPDARDDLALACTALCPAVRPRSFTASMAMCGVPLLPADLDEAILRHCSLPMLKSLSLAGFGCHEAVKNFLQQSGKRGGIQDMRRIRRELEKHNDSALSRHKTQVESVLDEAIGDRWEQHLPVIGSVRQLYVQARSAMQLFARDDFERGEIHLPLMRFPTLLWPAIVHYATRDGTWRLLNFEFDFKALQHDAILAALKAICPSAHTDANTRMNVFGVQGCHASVVLDWLRAAPLCTHLRLVYCSASALATLCRNLPHTSVKSLVMWCSQTVGNRDLITSILDNPKLETLSLRGCRLDHADAMFLCKALGRNTSLSMLNLTCIGFDHAGVTHLARALACNETLQYFVLSEQDLTVDACRLLGQALASNPGIMGIGLSAGGFAKGPDHARAFLGCLAKRDNLMHLEVNPMVLSRETMPVLEQVFLNNPHLSDFGEMICDDQQLEKDFFAMLDTMPLPPSVRFSKH
ncbi:MAG: hypothetical protein ACRYGK_19185 [Janthinobacterium lividum]